jgi:hypothetical protein
MPMGHRFTNRLDCGLRIGTAGARRTFGDDH